MDEHAKENLTHHTSIKTRTRRWKCDEILGNTESYLTLMKLDFFHMDSRIIKVTDLD